MTKFIACARIKDEPVQFDVEGPSAETATIELVEKKFKEYISGLAEDGFDIKFMYVAEDPHRELNHANS